MRLSFIGRKKQVQVEKYRVEKESSLNLIPWTLYLGPVFGLKL
jgi:hypothetical protein